MVELLTLRFTNPRSEIMKQIDSMTAVFQQLAAMKASMDARLQVGMTIASIDVVEMRPVVAALKTLADADVKGDSVADRLIEEWCASRIERRMEGRVRLEELYVTSVAVPATVRINARSTQPIRKTGFKPSKTEAMVVRKRRFRQ